MKERKKSLAPRILAIILCVLLLFTAALSIVIAANHVEKGELPYFFGIGVCSYNGAYDNDKDKIPQNAMIFIKKVDSKALRAGEVVVFYYADAPTLAKLYLASVLEVQEDGSLELYLGEAYGRRTVAAENLRGQMTSYLPYAGYAVSILEGRYGLLLSAATTVLLLAVLVLLIGGLIGDCGERRVRVAIAEARQKNADLGREMAGSEETSSSAAVQTAAAEEKRQARKEALMDEKPEVLAAAKKDSPTTQPVQREEVADAAARHEEPTQAAKPGQSKVSSQAEDLPKWEEQPFARAAEPIAPPESLAAETQLKENTANAGNDISTPPESAMEEVKPQTEATTTKDTLDAAETSVTAAQQEASAQAAESMQPEALPRNLRNSYVRGSFGSDRVSMEVACTEKEAEVMKKLLDLTAKKRNRFGLFTSVSHLEGCTLKVWCEWEDVPIVVSILTEVRKRTAQKGGTHGI